MIPDPLLALRAIVAADAEVASLAATRVFAAELPDTEAAQMPRAAAVLAASGGPPDAGYAPLAHRRVDLRTYGKTPLGAMKLHLAVHAVLKSLRRTPSLGVLVHSAALEAGPVALREPESGAEWPFVFASYDVLASEEAVA
jgi:hypothetical protein